MKVVVSLGQAPKKPVFIIDEHGRTLTKESLHRLISELFDKVLEGQNADAVVATGPTINNCANLASRITGRDIAEWELIYLHGSKYPPVLLAQEDKKMLTALLSEFSGTSAEAIYKVLADSGAYSQFD